MASATQLPPYANQAPSFLALYYVLGCIALALILVRSWVRTCITKNWGWDDTTIIVAWVCLLAGLVLVQIEANFGLGRHIEYLANPEEQALQILRFNTFFQIVNVLCTLITKISISIFILRLKNTKTLRWILVSLMVLMSLATLQVIIILCVSCVPMRKLWTPSIPGHCLDLNTVYICARVQSAFTIFTDLCLTISPIVILWKVKIDLKQKVLICLLMSLGLCATICNALRNVYQDRLTNKDFTYDIYPVTILAILELSSGIIAACIPAGMPLLKWHRNREQVVYQHGSSQTRYSKSNESNPKTSITSRGSQLSDIESLGSTLGASEQAYTQSAEKIHNDKDANGSVTTWLR